MTSASIASSPEISRRDLLIVALAAAVAAGVYLLASRLAYGIGFPLDDSWIHQTYARNLALRGEWAFRPGVPSAGSTSPLWSALLAVGFLLRLAPYIWTYLLGTLMLFALALMCEWIVRKLAADYVPRIPWVGLFIVFDWHFAWAAMSGMETLLHALILTTALALVMTNSPRYLTLGLLAGLSVWVRPDGLTLAGPVLTMILLIGKDARARLGMLARFLIGCGALIGFYLLFNLAVGGAPMPNTFYAKQAEYASWQARPILERLGEMALQLLWGPGILLLPGGVAWLIQSIRERLWGSLAAILWCLGYFGIYLWRLPMYQHGRYIMPAMPIFFVFGLLALADFGGNRAGSRYRQAVGIAWRSGVGVLAFFFIFIGARFYAQDVAYIESEMVMTAEWAAENLPAEAVVAAHDIGALGFFDDHRLIDLAGLTSPEVIPMLGDESRLAEFMARNGADYLIAFPGFYDMLAAQSEAVFVSPGWEGVEFGYRNLTVYRWKQP